MFPWSSLPQLPSTHPVSLKLSIFELFSILILLSVPSLILPILIAQVTSRSPEPYLSLSSYKFALASKIFLTWSDDKLGFSSHTSEAAPATCGAARLVPDATRLSPK